MTTEDSMSTKFTELEYQLGAMLWKSMLLGNPPPVTKHAGLWMQDVRSGDVAIEVSSWHAAWSTRIGVVIRVMYRVPKLKDITRLVLRTNDGEVPWENCEFVRIPVTDHQRRLARGSAIRCAAPCDDCDREQWKDDHGTIRQVLRT